ncbi:hypothetical protein H4R34_003169 [Dimargaris verticillata]|uniref:BCAS3 WD40 domain-containing protein n=1 Tax=Dimargaris verticillata TaxID=2761393 RepID=A0A9W8B538_9FUNG|nr:hypothetical protein H4R34_003169 [Dimargaris verticillata]
MDANGSQASRTSRAGRQAKPVFLKEPSSLESLTWAWSDLSSRVAQSLPTSLARGHRWTAGSVPAAAGQPPPSLHCYSQSVAPYATVQSPTSPLAPGPLHPAAQPWAHHADMEPDMEPTKVLFAGFDQAYLPDRLDPGHLAPMLCLGYRDGFQIWDIHDVNNICELVSVRNTVEGVTTLKCLPWHPETQAQSDTIALDTLPWVAVVHTVVDGFDAHPSSAHTPPLGNSLALFSLAQQKVVKSFTFAPHLVAEVVCNGTLVAVALTDQTLRLIDRRSFLEVASFDQVALPPTPTSYASRIALGPRLLAFPTTQTAPVTIDLSPGGHGALGPSSRQTVEKVAKEVVNGVKVLGNFGYKTLSNYFGAPTAAPPPQPYYPQPSDSRHPVPMAHSGRPTAGNEDVREPPGTLMVFDLKPILARPSPGTVTDAPLAHFTAHRHPIAGVVFNANHTLLATVSLQGHGVNVYSITGPHEAILDGQRPRSALNLGLRGVRHLYRLARGITDARVESMAFSPDSQWFTANTSRGTTHVFPINPQGGPIDAPAHLGPPAPGSPLDLGYSLANGSSVWAADLTLVSPVVRLKPQKPVAGLGPHSGEHDGGDVGGVFAMDMPYSLPPSASTNQRLNLRLARGSLVSCFAPAHVSPHWHANLHGQYHPNASFGTSAPPTALALRGPFKQLIQPVLLWVFHPQGLLTLYRLTPACVSQRGRTKQRPFYPLYGLTVTSDVLAEWHVARLAQWPTVAWSGSRVPCVDPSRASGSHPSDHSRHQWVSQVELVSCPLSHPEPLWALPQFQFQTIIRPSGPARIASARTLSDPWCPPVRNLELRRGAPRPYGTASMDTGDGAHGHQGHQLQARISKAINSVLDIRRPVGAEALYSAGVATVSPASDDFLAVHNAPVPHLYSEQRAEGASSTTHPWETSADPTSPTEPLVEFDSAHTSADELDLTHSFVMPAPAANSHDSASNITPLAGQSPSLSANPVASVGLTVSADDMTQSQHYDAPSRAASSTFLGGLPFGDDI